MKYKNLITTGLLALTLGCNSGDNLERTLQKTQFVTKPIVKKAVEDFCDSNLKDLWSLSTTARHTVFENEIGDDWSDRMYGALYGNDTWAKHSKILYEPILVKVREHIMESTRNYLKNPDNLMSIYQGNKENILDILNEKEKVDVVSKILDYALSGELSQLQYSDQIPLTHLK